MSRPQALVWLMAATTIGLAVAELALGPVNLGLAEIGRAFATLFSQGTGTDPVAETIVIHVRLPRVLLGIAVGGALGLSGCALQGILRNPLAEPGLIGISAGAAAGAVAMIVLGDLLVETIPQAARTYAVPLAALAGAGAVTAFVFNVSSRSGQTSVAMLILAGVAVNAIAAAAIGALMFVSTDQQLRDLTFWTLGGLGAGDWISVGIAAAAITVASAVLWRLRLALDLLQLGERAAFHAGLQVERSKRQIALATTLAVGCATAVAGPIGFVGLVAPHLARLMLGPAHRRLMPASAIVGASLVLAADLVVRTVVPPAEPPIGLATSLLGGPFFLWLLLTRLRRSAPYA